MTQTDEPEKQKEEGWL